MTPVSSLRSIRPSAKADAGALVSGRHWGRPRVTDDIDLTILTGLGGEETFIAELLRLLDGDLRKNRRFRPDRFALRASP
jgi:hypothetical protein